VTPLDLPGSFRMSAVAEGVLRWRKTHDQALGWQRTRVTLQSMILRLRQPWRTRGGDPAPSR
jgi:hypothetical protein